MALAFMWLFLDTGLLDSGGNTSAGTDCRRICDCLWRRRREVGSVSSQPNKWEHDHPHGTHVTSTILGYNLGGVPVNGAAPMATVIPVKVLNQNGSAGLRFARGITYVADLKSPARWQITL